MLDRTEPDPVRERANRQNPTRDPMLRIKVRVDVWLGQTRWDCSMVAWSHPGAELVINELWQLDDDYHIGMAPADICARIAESIGVTPEPFP